MFADILGWIIVITLFSLGYGVGYIIAKFSKREVENDKEMEKVYR